MRFLAFLPAIGLLMAASVPTSGTYQLNTYSVGGGSTNNSSSSNYTLQGSTGEVSGGPSSSSNYTAKSGSIQAEQANVPPAPTLTGGAFNNKINFVINTGNNPSDAKFSVAASTSSSFATTNYVHADGTLGASPVYQTYAQWGSTTGTFATGLTANTAYWFKVDATQGKFTNSAYGPAATASTAGGPTVAFSLSPNTMNMGSLLAGSIITSPSNVSLTFSTNAANGGSIYMSGQFTGLHSTTGNYTLQVLTPSGNLSALNEGFGLRSLSASSPLSAQSPYNGTTNVVGTVYTTFQPVFSAGSSVTNGTATAALMAKSSASTPIATDYQDTLTFVAAAVF
jgi:hypothetical protein